MNPDTHYAKKFDEGKPRFDLIDPQFELDLALVLEYGAKVHGDNSWKTVPNAVNRYWAAFRRHHNAIQLGELTDKQTGLPHTACMTANMMFLSYFYRTPTERVEPTHPGPNGYPISVCIGKPRKPYDKHGNELK